MTEDAPVSSEPKPENGLEAAAAEKSERTLTVLGQDFQLIEKLTVPVTYAINKAQREEDLSLLIEAVAKMVVPSQREKFLDLILSESTEDDQKELDLEEFNDIFQDAIERVAGRPLEQS